MPVWSLYGIKHSWHIFMEKKDLKMSRHDNTFEAQILSFYGDKLDDHLFTFFNEELNKNEKSRIAFSLLTFLIAIKKKGYLFSDIQAECHKMQHELYNQLEKDRSCLNT